MRLSNPLLIVVLLGCGAGLSGCYEDLGNAPPPPAQSQSPPTQQSGPVQQGPITSATSPQGSSTLGAAKSAATNIIGQAQDESGRIADGEGWDD